MPMKSFRDRNPLAVGAVSITVVALAVTAAFLVGTLGLLADRYTMTGVFAETGELRSGNKVKVAGVEVGQVSAVRPDFEGSRVVVTWKVDRGIDLGPDTRAEVRMSNILGGRHLELSGPVSKPYLADLPEERRRIPVERTATPSSINDVLDAGTKAMSRIDTEMIGRVLDQLDGVSRSGQGKLGSALKNLTTLAETVNRSEPQIRMLLDNGDRLVGLVNAKESELSRLADNISALLAQLRDRQAELSVLLGGGDRTVTRLSRLISAKQQRLITVIDELDGTLKGLKPQIAQLNEALTWAGPTIAAFTNTGADGPWVNAVFSQVVLSGSDLQKLVGPPMTGGTRP